MNHAVNFALEPLEQRVFLSASIVSRPTGEILSIKGTNHSDKITVGIDGTNANLIDVTINGTLQQFDKTNIHTIFIQAFAGNDIVRVDETHGLLPVGIKVSAGTGVDNITGSSLADSISGGAGNDYLIGNGGDDLIYGRTGNDIIWGDAGNDTITGDDGKDELFGGDGNDNVSGGLDDDVINVGTGLDTADGGAGINHVDDAYSKGFSNPIEHNAAQIGNNAFIGAPTGYVPDQIRAAYGLGNVADPGFTNRGAGQAIAIINWNDDPTAEADLAAFSSQFGLPLPDTTNFEVVYAGGTQPTTDLGASSEDNLDLQWAHAIAPDAKLILVEAATSTSADILQAIQVASQKLETEFGGGVVNMSFGTPFGDESDAATWEPVFNDPAFKDVTYVSSSGDVGGIISYPSTSARVLSVGGTAITLDAGGNRLGPETAWDEGGGGLSGVISAPVYQIGLTVNGVPTGSQRATPDVSMVADPNTGVSVYTGFIDPGDGDSGWHTYGGTSASGPMWAGLIAMVNEQRKGFGLNLIGEGAVAKIYGLAETNQNLYFNDITLGSNGFPAEVGYDLATGWGTPKADTLISALADNSSFATGTADFAWHAEYLEATQKYPGGVQSSLAADFSGHGTAYIGVTAAFMAFSIEQQFAGNLLQITASGLTITDGNIYGTGTATVVGPITSNLYTIAIAGKVNVDHNGKFQIKGSFSGLSPVTGTDPIPGAEEQFFGNFSSH